jgi:hypothetical protein
MTRAKLVIGKAGFQQIVEAICMGAPIVCRMCGGGVNMDIIPEYLRPFVRLIADDLEITGLARRLPEWLRTLPHNPWPRLAASIPEPVSYAASVLRDQVNDVCEFGPGASPVDGGPVRLPLGLAGKSYELFRLVERKDWAALESALASASISIHGSVMSSADLSRTLCARIGPATHLKVVPLAVTSLNRYRCCISAMEPESWSVRDIEFGLQLGFASDGSTLTSLDVTPVS